MTASALVRRGLAYYWRTNVAVVLGVATAVAVLAGALLVGASVRGSLRDLVLLRLGHTDRIVVSTGFFREALADEVRADASFAASFTAVAPLVAVQGLVSDQASGRRVSRVMVYGVDDRFWRFQGLAETSSGGRGPSDRDVLLSPALASDLGVAAGGTVLVRLERPSAIPIESLHGRKEDRGRTLRLTARAVLGPEAGGEFSLRPQQGPVRAVFVSLKRLQQELDLDGRVNTLVVADRADAVESSAGPAFRDIVRRRAALEDVGLAVRALDSRGVLALESPSGLIDSAQAAAADRAAATSGMQARAVFTYLATTLRSGTREVPYSLVTAIDLASIVPAEAVARSSTGSTPIVVNDWTARELGVKAGDPVALDYVVWQEPGQLAQRTADFTVSAVVPIAGAAADRDFAPRYPGISDADSLGQWDPPFPIDLRRVRPIDEAYWKQYRTTPKAFIPLEAGAALWRSRYGDRTSIRITPKPGDPLDGARDRFVAALRAGIDPMALGLSVQDVRVDGLNASRGATDFAEYFTYFSFFLVLSALFLAGLFFRVGIEQRAREVGLLRAVGFTTARVRALFAAEGLVLSACGGLVGTAGAVAYAAAMLAGLRTWWVGAVGTTAITLHVAPLSLAAGSVGAVVAAMAWIWWTLRGMARLSERSLLAGSITTSNAETAETAERRSPLISGLGFGALAVGLLAATLSGRLDPAAGFFGAGTSLLVACLCLIAFRLRQAPRSSLGGRGWWQVSRVGLRNAAIRPGRSVLAIGVIASATFILISVDAFRLDSPRTTDRHSGVGGYPLLVDLLVPMAHDPNSREGRDALGLNGMSDVAVEPFRVLPGDDASCLNLYEPRRPRVMGVSQQFIESGRFGFQRSLAPGGAARVNPWLLLNQPTDDGAVPVIVDANSMTYVLHKSLGDDVVMEVAGQPLRLRLVAALDDSIFQGELLMSEATFVKLFPDQSGYQFLLVEAPAARVAEVEATIENLAADLGADAVRTDVRLAEFHTVENTYLSTFQALGGLGLLLGTVGLAAVLIRNVLERRREMALLGAVGYRRPHLLVIVLAENVLLLGWGLAVGALCAFVAIGPAVAERGGRLPAAAGAGVLLVAVLAAGLLSSLVATRVALSGSLLGALRAE